MQDPMTPAAGMPGQRLTITNPRLTQLQRVHAIGISGIGAAGVAGVLYRCFSGIPARPASITLLLLFFFLGCAGITVGFHRYFTHRSFQTSRWIKIALGILGSMNGQGPVVYWAAVHRRHHMHADKPGDPHSPHLHGATPWGRLKGALHAFIGWTVSHEIPNTNTLSRDLLADEDTMWVNKRYYLWLLLGWTLPALIGGLAGGTLDAALEGLLWGGLLRMFLVNKSMFAIALFGHAPLLGSRDYATNDNSHNSPWLALPTLGDSLHNNHHAFPRAAIIGLRWWQLDISGLLIAGLEKLGLASEVCRVSPEDMLARRAGRS